MLQVIQYQKTGEISVDESPAPKLRQGCVLVRNVFSLISAGTERTSVEIAQASLVRKARMRQDLVRQVMDNVKRDDLVATYNKVQDRLDHFNDLGYSSAGVVLGEQVVVIGLGLIGLLTMQLLKASGCRVLGMDVSTRNFDVALKLDAIAARSDNSDSGLEVQAFMRGHGADAILITAATKSDEPVELAMQFARKRSSPLAPWG